MGDLAKSIIGSLKLASKADDLDGWIWKAGDLLAKSQSAAFKSGFEDIDKEEVSHEEKQQIQDALLEALRRSTDPSFIFQILEALRQAPEKSLKQTYVDYLVRFLTQIKACNRVIHTSLQALNDLGESVYETTPGGASSPFPIEVDRNIRQADRYLLSRGVAVPW